VDAVEIWDRDVHRRGAGHGHRWSLGIRGRLSFAAAASTRRAGAISAPNWSREFEDPIVLTDGRKLVTLRDAATYITKLPKAEQDLEIWQIAVENLIRAAETGGAWLMLARIGVLKALHRDRVREFNPDRKETHWGTRKLKRDQWRPRTVFLKKNPPLATGASLGR
jgi:hypothetical protein